MHDVMGLISAFLEADGFKCVSRDVDVTLGGGSVEVCCNEQDVVLEVSDKDILPIKVLVDIHQVKKFATSNGLFAKANI